MISIVIPAYNEEDSITNLIEYLLIQGGDKVEIILVDGGSSDATMDVAEKAGARVLQSPEKGRSKQMNFGAQSAKYDILYFLHADTYPPKDFKKDIADALKLGFDAGCYRLSFDNPNPLLKFYCWFTRFDIDVFRFGDQSLFVRKEVFEKAGYFDEKLIVMEDQEIVKSLKKVSKFKIFKRSVITSARKYEKIGIIKLQLIFTSVLTMHYLGIDQQKIVDFYFRKIQ